MMKARKFFPLLLLPGLTTVAQADDGLPKTAPFSHYAPRETRSPFAVPSATAPVGSKPDFAKDLYVANAAHSTEGDFVTIASTTDKNLKEYLNTREVVNGYSISNIQWSDKVGETKVTISKDGQFATLTFNEALLSQAIQNPIPTAPQPVVNRPPAVRNGLPTPALSVPRPMPVPQIPTPPPHTRGVIRHRTNAARNNAPVTQPQQHPSSVLQPVDGDDDDDDFEEP
jgi:hypothetical protein